MFFGQRVPTRRPCAPSRLDTPLVHSDPVDTRVGSPGVFESSDDRRSTPGPRSFFFRHHRWSCKTGPERRGVINVSQHL